jgi:hypothetical protein
MFITEFTRALQLYLSLARPIQSYSSNPISTRSTLMLSIQLRLGLLSGLFASGFPTSKLYTFLLSPIRAKCPAHVILIYLIILIKLCEEYRSCSSSLCSFLHPPITSFLFGPNILLSNLSSNTVSPCYSLNIRDQVSHPYRSKGILS